MTLYEDLGVPKSSDRESIKRAYRKRAQKLHPDRPGGDKEKFHAIQKAYDVLGDDARRAYYDAHGTDGQVDARGALMQRLAALFMQCVQTQDVDHVDIIALMRQGLQQGKVAVQGNIRAEEQKIAKYERTKKRLTRKGAGENLFIQMLDGQISLTKRGIEMGKAEIATQDEMLAVLEDYTYNADSAFFQAFGRVA